jgi:hypothetical protein
MGGVVSIPMVMNQVDGIMGKLKEEGIPGVPHSLAE